MKPALVCGVLLAGTLLAAVSAAERPGYALKLTGMTFVVTRGNVNVMVLEADRVHLPADADKAKLERVKGRLEGEKGEGGFTLTCDRAELDLNSQNFRAEGHVRGVTGDGRRLSTTWLTYDGEKHLISTDAPVEIVEGSRRMRGRGLRYYVDDGRFRLLGGATVVQE